MKRRLTFVAALFFTTVLAMVLQRVAFLLYYHAIAAQYTLSELCQSIWHGLRLDCTVAGYVTTLPLLLCIIAIWLPLSQRLWRSVLITYLTAISVAVSAIFAVDMALYEFWGYRIDGSILIYLASPRDAMASVELWQAVRQTFIFATSVAMMVYAYWTITKLFDKQINKHGRLVQSIVLVLIGGVLFIVIRGGVSVSTANISKVYFSSKMFLNHTAVNPTFSLLSTIGDNEDYGSEYPFFEEPQRAEQFDALRGDRDTSAPADSLLTTSTPNIVLIICESFSRSILDKTVDGQAVMPKMQRLREEGVWFENIYANSFRTDRGVVSILNGFPAQTKLSIMKLPAKSRQLPSLATSLKEREYSSMFVYGGDLNFTNMASYLYSTGWERLIWQNTMSFDVPTSKWGYADDVVGGLFADEVLKTAATQRPYIATWLTMSSHEPFDVPYSKFSDKLLNSMAFADNEVGRVVERLRESSAWGNMLVIIVADHAFPYPEGVAYNSPERHRIPMIWTGGAVRQHRVVEEYMSQMDIATTLLTQLGIDHTSYPFSKNVLSDARPHFGYFAFSDGFGVVDASGATIFDCTSNAVIEQRGSSNPSRTEIGKTILQTTYKTIGEL